MVVIGGVVGITLAREPSRYHLDVVVLERDAEVGVDVIVTRDLPALRRCAVTSDSRAVAGATR